MKCRECLAVCIALLLLLVVVSVTHCGIVPPPWSDPQRNPCASLPGGWQLLYWSPLKQCFKIFTVGYPCPDTMELSPTIVRSKSNARNNATTAAMSLDAPAAECRCPPGTAINTVTEKCHRIFERGPCETGQYFGPLPEFGGQVYNREISIKPNNNRLGQCRMPRQCPENMLYWPKDNKCYVQYSRGPCEKGNLLVLNEDGLAECKCANTGPLSEYFHGADNTCHEHFTKGPCSTPGHIFLPGGECGCSRNLPHYDAAFNMCFELDSIGPCARGHVFSIPESEMMSDNEDNGNEDPTPSSAMLRARCQCKAGYVSWTDGNCYRLYTRGPCEQHEFLINATTCVRNFCGKSRLYFPKEKTCYRIGSQGPCAIHQVVVFDFMARPSVDGISYNGVCGCSGVITNLNQQCNMMMPSNDGGDGDADQQLIAELTNPCDAQRDAVALNGQCFKLYSRGPCGPGQWLEPIKSLTTNALQAQYIINKRAKCVCRPGYKQQENTNQTNCNAPTVELAKYLTTHKNNVLF